MTANCFEPATICTHVPQTWVVTLRAPDLLWHTPGWESPAKDFFCKRNAFLLVGNCCYRLVVPAMERALEWGGCALFFVSRIFPPARSEGPLPLRNVQLRSPGREATHGDRQLPPRIRKQLAQLPRRPLEAERKHRAVQQGPSGGMTDKKDAEATRHTDY